MALTSNDFPISLTKGVLANFEEGKNEFAAQATYPLFTQQVPSTAAAEKLVFLGDHYNFQQWTDTLSEKAFKEYSITVTNNKYGDRLVLEKDAMDDDQTGNILTRARSLGEESEMFMETTMWGTITANTATGYDSKALFANDHDWSGSNQDNLLGSTLSFSALDTAVTAMRNFKDDQGKPLLINPTHLLVPPALEVTAKQLVQSVLQPGADSDTANAGLQSANPFKGTLQVVVSPFITATTAWYLFDLSHTVKPVVWVNRQDTQLIGPIDVPQLDRFEFIAKKRGAAAIGKWQYALQGNT